MKSILDPKRDGKYPFDYTPSAQTDLAKTFARVRKEQRANEAERVRVVTPISTPARERRR